MLETTHTPVTALLDRIRTRTARVGVIGLGYVGLPLAVEFAHAGFDVTGFDVDQTKTDQINAGGSGAPPRTARHPRVDDLSGHDRRSRAADARGERPEGRRRFLPRLFARAR